GLFLPGIPAGAPYSAHWKMMQMGGFEEVI
ncbi:unnamed protein product, partial [marine sediment metagenome]